MTDTAMDVRPTVVADIKPSEARIYSVAYRTTEHGSPLAQSCL